MDDVVLAPQGLVLAQHKSKAKGRNGTTFGVLEVV
jgi:hypothetical protein